MPIGYSFVNELGRGGFGCVILIKDAKSGQQFAMKTINTKVAWATEAIAVHDLKHPNIVRVLKAGFVDKCPYFLMEYCAGGDLAKYIEKQTATAPINTDLVVCWFMQLCDAIDVSDCIVNIYQVLHTGVRYVKYCNILKPFYAQYLHTKQPKVLHGDMKPQNVLLTESGESVKLADFGLAKVTWLTSSKQTSFAAPGHTM
jgi:serine/threonine protein kinase